MKLSSFDSTTTEYNLDLDYYHGKDFVHKGYLIPTNPDKVWSTITSSIRNKLKKPLSQSLDIRLVSGTEKDVKDFLSIWFDPNDPTIPKRLQSKEIMYLAYLNHQLSGGLILSPSGHNTLYLHNLGSTSEGKHHDLPAKLIWHAVNQLKDHPTYMFIDIGTSFRQPLFDFFRQWHTYTYPIIFEPPFIKPVIRLSPFINNSLPDYQSRIEPITPQHWFSKDQFTIFPRTIFAIKALIKHLRLKPEDEVCIYKTMKNQFITRCVTEAIENQCLWSTKISSKTKLVMIIHEFGYPCDKTPEIYRQCQELKIPLVENCAWTTGSKIDQNHQTGDYGDYVLYSLPKIFPMAYGSVLAGLSIKDNDLWSEYGALDYYKRQMITKDLIKNIPIIRKFNNQKRRHWRYLAKLFIRDGYLPVFPLKPGVNPSALVIKFDSLDEINLLYDRYLRFGVEVGRYYPENALYFPIHQNLSYNDLDYIYAIFRGYLNLCSEYRRG